MHRWLIEGERRRFDMGGWVGGWVGGLPTFEDVKHAGHLAKDQHPVALLLELLEEFVCKGMGGWVGGWVGG